MAPLVAAQQGEEVFSFLRYPTSSRINALGGQNVSLIERDPSLIFHNPALLGAEMDGLLNLNYMNFFGDIHTGSALYTKAKGENSAWGVGAGFMSYGNFKQTTPEMQIEGEFSVEDISINAFYSRDLSEKWRGGVSLKFLYSSIERYSSIGLAVDAGLSYYDSAKELAVGIVVKNAGAQLKAYYEDRYRLPWDIQLGFSKRLAYAPFRLSVTSLYLTNWDISFIEHFVAGIDFIPSENFWLGVGYNPKVARDLKLESGNGLGGFSIGGGVKIKTFDIGVSVARYHPSALSLMVSLSKTLP
ncbi:hypothetical protein FACS189414_4320 [Bacteroidia bacterium]|nr:hypothetical protein FACS189414_4320 [Bacteroidia bacterium]